MLNRLRCADKFRQNTKTLTIFAQRSSRGNVVSCLVSLTSDRIPSSQMEPELLHTIAQIKPLGTDGGPALKRLRRPAERSERSRLERSSGTVCTNPQARRQTVFSKLAAFAYHSHRYFPRRTSGAACNYEFISNPLVGAAFGSRGRMVWRS